MAGQERSQIAEEMPEELLEEENTFRIVVLDNDRIKYDAEAVVDMTNPFEFDPTRFNPNISQFKLEDFFDVSSKLIENAQTRQGIVSSKHVQVTEEYPPETFEHFGDEVICYRVLSRKPANMNAKATDRPQRKSTYAYDVVKAEYPNKVLVIESRPIDHLIEFSCWAKSNKLANKRVLWLEKLFINYGSWVFAVKGAERFYWKDRGPDTYTTTGGQRMFYRPLNFFVRLREFEVKAHSQIKQIEVETSLV